MDHKPLVQFQDILVGQLAEVKSLRLSIRQSDSTRCHAWVRYALKEGSIGSFLSILCEDGRLLREFYKPASFVRDATKMESAKSLIIHAISSIQFHVTIESIGSKQEINPEMPQEITYTSKMNTSDVPNNWRRRRKTRGNSANIVNIEDSVTNGEFDAYQDSDRQSLTGSIVSFPDEDYIEQKAMSESKDVKLKIDMSVLPDKLSSSSHRDDKPTNDVTIIQTIEAANVGDGITYENVLKDCEDGTVNPSKDKQTLNQLKRVNKVDRFVNSTHQAEVIHQIDMDEVTSHDLASPLYDHSNSQVDIILPNENICVESNEFETNLNEKRDITKPDDITDLKLEGNEGRIDCLKDGISEDTVKNNNETTTEKVHGEGKHESFVQNEDKIITSAENNNAYFTFSNELNISHSPVSEQENENNADIMESIAAQVSTSSNKVDMNSITHTLKISGSLNHSLSSAFQSVHHIETQTSLISSTNEHLSAAEFSSIPESNSNLGNNGTTKLRKIINVIKAHENEESKKSSFDDTFNKSESSSQIDVSSDVCNHIENVSDNSSTDTSDLVNDIVPGTQTRHLSRVNSEIDDSQSCSKSPATSVDLSKHNSSGSVDEEYRNQADVYHDKTSSDTRYEVSGSQQLINVLQTSALNDPSNSSMEEYYIPGIHTSSDAPLDKYKNNTPQKGIDILGKQEDIESPSSPASSSFKYFEKNLFQTQQQNTVSNSSYNSRKSTAYDARSFYSDSGSDSCSTSDQSFSILADLGITDDFIGIKEDHFTSESFMGFSSHEELGNAISTCKQLIRQAPGKSQRKKDLVTQLVQLRLKQHEIKESSETETPKGVKKILGHQFYKQGKLTSTFDCDACAGTMFPLLQTVYMCNDCGFHCHRKCLKMLDKPCVHNKKLTTGTYELRICPEIGLALQQYRCADCHKRFQANEGNVDARLCDYTGQKYCLDCHWNETCVIPARVIHNWDFDMYHVSRQSKHVLQLLSRKPEIDLQQLNPALFNFVDELRDIKFVIYEDFNSSSNKLPLFARYDHRSFRKCAGDLVLFNVTLREQIIIMKIYVSTCRIATEERLLLQLQNRQHFVDNSHTYSLKDLIDVHNDVLLDELTRKYANLSKHIKFDCPLCQGKGFFCEICKGDEVIFPFDSHVVRCKDCNTTFHRACFNQRNCPKCERNAMRKSTDQVLV